LFINYQLIIFPLKQSPAAHWIHLPAGRCVSTHVARNAAQRTELAVDQLSTFYHQRPVASKFAGYEPNGLSCVGCNVRSLPQLKTKPKIIAELKHALQVIWGNLPQGPIDKSVKDFSKRLKACVGAGDGHFEHSQ